MWPIVWYSKSKPSCSQHRRLWNLTLRPLASMPCIRPLLWLSYFSRYGHFKFFIRLLAADGCRWGLYLIWLVCAHLGRHIIICSIHTRSTIYPIGSRSFMAHKKSYKYVSLCLLSDVYLRRLWTDSDIIEAVWMVFLRCYAFWAVLVAVLVMVQVVWQCHC